MNYDRVLDKLTVLLRKKMMTAREIAVETKCSRVTAYQRIRDLISRGEDVIETKNNRSKTPGPRAIKYGIL